MAVVEQLIRSEDDGTISFGNYTLDVKAKLGDFEHAGDLYKVKTFRGLTRLEKNGMFVYESVPGTSVTHFCETENGVSFTAEGNEDVQIMIELEEDKEYEVFVAGEEIGKMKTNLGGKVNISVELAGAGEVKITVEK